jgi:glycyl-tRNA synthetase
MLNLYNKNGLIFWTEENIILRKSFENNIVERIYKSLLKQNQGFKIFQIEAPLLTPIDFINKNYTSDDIYIVDDLCLRPETTMGSFEYAKYLLTNHHNELKIKPPLIVWQHGKSFRKEQEQSTKFMRLKEFYQLEFQIIFSPSTANDYYSQVLQDTNKILSDFLGNCFIEKSDRLPDYSEETYDVVNEKNSMEICSISKRKDLENYKVIEIAIGTDRCIYNFLNK